jgi:cytoskeleton-associated protein 5
LGAARAGTKKRAIELCGMFVEVENTGEGVMVCLSYIPDFGKEADLQMDLLPGIDAKQPKIVAGCIGCLKDLIEYASQALETTFGSPHRSFGVTAVGNIKPLLKVIPKVFGHSDKTVRAEGSALLIARFTTIISGIEACSGDGVAKEL